MPPKKKSQKAIEDELKKKTTAQAKDILAKLKGETSKTLRVLTDDLKKSSSSRKKTEKSTSEASKRERASKSQRTDRDSADKSKKLANATVTSIDIDSRSTLPVSVALPTGETSSTSQGEKSVQAEMSNSQKSKTAISRPKSSKPKGAEYHYEIDCKRVADSIDVTDLKKHLEKNLKMNGKKDNLSGIVSIHCEGQKAIIKSRVFFPKKSLRFLSKNFLKKNWNIHVVSKNVHSYEYKYVGTV